MSSLLPYAYFFLLVIIAGIFLGYFRYWKAKKKVVNSNAVNLKKHGRKISVDLLASEVKHREYYEENEIGGKTLRDISIIIYSAEVDGIIQEFKSPSIFLSKDKLLTRLSDKKETFIYVDSSNSKNYYFDLEFIIEFVM